MNPTQPNRFEIIFKEMNRVGKEESLGEECKEIAEEIALLQDFLAATAEAERGSSSSTKMSPGTDSKIAISFG